MTKEERRAEKIRMLVQSGSLLVEAAHALRDAQEDTRLFEVSFDHALLCVLTAEITCAIRQASDKNAQEGRK